MKKFLACLIFALFAALTFAQNVKPYTVDLNNMDTSNDDKTATFDRKTGTVTIKKNTANIYLWTGDIDISNYNIARVKYKASRDCGFIFVLDYDDETLTWTDKSTYCPSYLDEMVITILPGQKKICGILFQGTWNVDSYQFIIESVTFEKVANPVTTDVFACDEPPVIDTVASGKIDEKLSAWDFVSTMGVGWQYPVFGQSGYGNLDFGMDFYYCWNRYGKPTKKIIELIKQKGFKTIRLQTTPGDHILDSAYTIDPRYIAAIKEVVDWALEENLNVIICGPFADYMKNETYRKVVKENVHYAAYLVNEENKTESKEFIKAVWTQYARAFNNSYDEHLIFETLNEPVHVFHEHEVLARTDCEVCKKDYAILNEYNQLIVDTIRSTGGNNAKRFIMVEGLGYGRWQCITNNLFKLPKDKAKNKLIPAVHHYPLGDGPDAVLLYSKGIKNQITEEFAALDKYYFKKHIPVYFSEIGFDPDNIPVLERLNCMKDLMAEITKKGRSCAANHDDNFSYINLLEAKWNEDEAPYLNSLIYASQGKEYPLSEDFIKQNEIKIESIVGKNLLNEPFVPYDWDSGYEIKSETFIRSVPEKYKLEFQIEKTGSKPILQVCFIDKNENFTDIASRSDVKVTGAVKGWCFEVQSDTIVITVSEKLAIDFESNGFYINGQDIIIKSVKVIE